MSKVAGWRIQIIPQYAEHDLTASVFMNVELPDLARAISFVRSRAGCGGGERIYPVRPLRVDELCRPQSSGL